VTGPRINLTEELIDRIHNLFIAKLSIHCIAVSTPWKPIGFFYDIDNNSSAFKKLYLDYTLGLALIFYVQV